MTVSRTRPTAEGHSTFRAPGQEVILRNLRARRFHRLLMVVNYHSLDDAATGD